ncbi:MAG TPA: hypothetical protein VKX24_13020 [Acidimicrobiia bacterium]|nr:hypothetical protein [Acidimicrobiia bacterium]
MAIVTAILIKLTAWAVLHWRGSLAASAAVALLIWWLVSPPATRVELVVFAGIAAALAYRLAKGLA